MSILRTADVVHRTGLSRTTLWRLERKGDFPTRVHLGLNSVGWRVEEIDAWIDRRPRGIARVTGGRTIAIDDAGRRARGKVNLTTTAAFDHARAATIDPPWAPATPKRKQAALGVSICEPGITGFAAAFGERWPLLVWPC